MGNMPPMNQSTTSDPDITKEELYRNDKANLLQKIPQTRLAGTASSIFFGFGKFKLFMIVMNSSLDLVNRGFNRFSSPIDDSVNPL